MSCPWERPAAPTQPDADIQILYASVGQALTHWEQIESELSIWFALFIDKMWQHEAYDQYYEEGRTCRRRINTVEKAGEQFFIKKPDQRAESDFSTLIRATRGFADRRHELAHGIVRPVQWFWTWVSATMKPPEGVDYEYCLVPPHYQRSWFDAKEWRPDFVYTSKEIYEIDRNFVEHLHLLLHYRNDYLPKSPRPLT